MELLRKNMYIIPLINLKVLRNLLRKNQYPSRGALKRDRMQALEKRNGDEEEGTDWNSL